ncbi:DUF4352 domain-containing protein [Natronosalvus rutilus]|uniref:DUF4352 domain-containing protein n=1 Tax=Natronosalvus rutilus TaxID=2953753 RepID=A0A9E7N9F7_9EURY|nr:DUF4352 domain-containing protein [Natronosalvus rutilus]UTF53256.1 DUF4352 domain-containing protein [Natronosalvus rutilus]
MIRRVFLGVLGSIVATAGTSASAAAQEDTSAVVGELIEGDPLHLVVEGARLTDSLGEFTEAETGSEFLVVRIAYKNTSEEFHTVSGLLSTRVRDDESYTYDQSFYGTAEALNDGQIAPGEVERGDLVYEVPEDASGFILEFDFDIGLFGDLERAVIDLETTSDDPATLEQELAIDVHGIGDTVEHEGTAVTVNEATTETQLDEFTEAAADHEYVVVDLTVENTTGEEQHVSTLLQMQLKDGEGLSYDDDLGATSSLERAFEQGAPIADGDERRGQLAYEVEAGREPLYWVFEFSLFAEGDKTFWQLR